MEPERRWAHSWVRAAVVTLGIAFVLFATFAVVPDRLADLVERRSRSSVVRDLVLAVWFTGSVATAIWGLVGLQRRRII